MDLKEVSIIGEDIENHWYYMSKAGAIKKLIKNINPHIILDIGSGSGFFTKYLLKHTNAGYAFCVDTSYELEYEEKHNGKNCYFKKSIDKYNADLVLMMDVLEHVEDDSQLLREYIEKVPSQTYFLITVPAFNFLWSSHDEFLEHKRRYTLKQMNLLASNSDLQVISAHYYFGLLFPIVLILRIGKKFFLKKNNKPKSELKKHAWLINFILVMLCKFEYLLMRFNLIAGLSIVLLAQKK
jgi:trans-aconitate methyltransferase